MKIRLDGGLEYEAPQEVVVAYDKLKADNTTLQAKLDTTEARADSLQADKVKLDNELKAKDKQHADGLDNAVKQRVSLLSVAEKYKIDKADEMTDRQIKEAVITSVRGDGMDLGAKSDEYIQAAFDFVDAIKNDDVAAQNRLKLNTKQKQDDAAEMTSSEKRAKMIEDMKNDHKGVQK